MKKTLAAICVLVLLLAGSSFGGIFGSSSGGSGSTWFFNLPTDDSAPHGHVSASASMTTAGINQLDWHTGVFNWTDGCGTYENLVTILGFNINADNLLLNSSYGGEYFGMESNYCVGGRLSSEYYMRFRDSGGTVHQGFGGSFAHDGSFSDFLIAGDIINFTDRNGVQLWKMDRTVTPWESYWFGRTTTEPHTISSTANGCPWIRQRNSADSAYLSYPCFRDANGGTAGGEEFLYSNSSNLPWYSVANPQSGATWPTASFAFQQSSSSSHGDSVLLTQSPSGSSLNQWGYRGFGSTTDIFGISLENQGNGYSVLALQVPSGGADPFVRFYNAVTYWSLGLDNSDSDAFVLSQGSTLGSNNRLRIDTGGAVTHAGIALASVSTTTAGTMFYCNNCNVATPCTSGGAGAWAFRTSGGTWACPF